MRKSINIGGVSRAGTVSPTSEGAMQCLINARRDGGVMRPVYPRTPVSKPTSNTLGEVYIHVVDSERVFVAYAYITGVVHYWREGYASPVTLTNVGTYREISFSSLKATLVIHDHTGNRLLYSMFDTGTMLYTYMGLTPGIPRLTFGPKLYVSKYLNFTVPSSTITPDDMQAGLEWQYEKWREQGVFEGYVIIIYGIELMDGSIIKPSNPELVYVGNKDFDPTNPSNYEQNTTLEDGSKVLKATAFKAGTVQYRINDYSFNVGETTSIRTTWSKYIRGIAIFMTRPVSRVIADGFLDDMGYGVKLNEEKMRELLIHESMFYRVGFVPSAKLVHNTPWTELVTVVDELTSSYAVETGNTGSRRTKSEDSAVTSGSRSMAPSGRRPQTVIGTRSNVSPGETKRYGPGVRPGPSSRVTGLGDLNTIVTNEVLPVDQFSHHQVSGSVVKVYNSRLLLGNITQVFWEGYHPYYLWELDWNGAGNVEIWLEWVIDTRQGTRIVRTGNGYRFNTSASFLPLPDYISYPDLRAKKLRILMKFHGFDPGTFVIAELDTKQHKIHNISYVVGGYNLPIPQVVDNLQLVTWSPSAVIQDVNRLQGSETNNALYFPSYASYQVGSDDILDMEINTEPVSEGQFGSFPLVIFTRSGIYTANIGDGEVFINSITPFSGEVLRGKNMALNTGEGIIFIDDKGKIKLLAGRRTVEISKALEGPPLFLLSGEPDHAVFINHASLIQAQTVINTCNSEYLEKYLGGSVVMGFDRVNKELIVSNPSYGYTWVYNMISRAWYAWNTSFKAIFSNYPTFYAVYSSSNNMIDLAGDKLQADITAGTTSPVMIYAETRPLDMDVDVLKKIERLQLVANLKIEPGKHFGLYLFGSNDLTAWKYISGKQVSGNVNNIIISSNMLSCKYYKIVLAGWVSHDSVISSLTVELGGKYINKIR